MAVDTKTELLHHAEDPSNATEEQENSKPWKKGVASFCKLIAATVPLSDEVEKPIKRRKSVEPLTTSSSNKKNAPLSHTPISPVKNNTTDPKELMEMLETERLKRQQERWNSEEEIAVLQQKIASLEKCLQETNHGITDPDGNEELVVSLLERITALDEAYGGCKITAAHHHNNNNSATLKASQEAVLQSLNHLRAVGSQLKSKYNTTASKARKKRRHSWFDSESKTMCIEDLKQDLIKQTKESHKLSSKLQKSLVENKEYETKVEEMLMELTKEKEHSIALESEKNLIEAKYQAELEQNALFRAEMEKLHMETSKEDAEDENTREPATVSARVTTIETKLLKAQLTKLQQDYYAMERQKNQAIMQLGMETQAKETLVKKLKCAEASLEEHNETIEALTEQLEVGKNPPNGIGVAEPQRHRRVQSAMDASDLKDELKDFLAGRGHI